MKFDFATATKIRFGPGILAEAAVEIMEMGKRVFLMTGKSVERTGAFKKMLEGKNRLGSTFVLSGEPTVEIVTAAVEKAKATGCDMVVAVGGGSVIDAGKAVAALLTNPGELFDYLEVIGKGMRTATPSAPFVAVPTTAGTGAEVTMNAVIGSVEHKVKVSMRSPLMLPRLAIADPALTLTLDPETTAATGLDALTQLIEAFTSRKANPLTDALCREGLFRAARSLRQACSAGHDLAARQDMMVASLFSGLALANGGLGAVHGIAAPLGGMLFAPHGVVCAGLLFHVVETNLEALKKRVPNSKAMTRYRELAQILTGKPESSAADGVQWVKKLCADLKTPSLSEYGLNAEVFDTIADKAMKASSMKGNPVELTENEIMGVLERAAANVEG